MIGLGKLFGILLVLSAIFIACSSDEPTPEAAVPVDTAVHPCDETTAPDPFGIQPARLAHSTAEPLPPAPAVPTVGTEGGRTATTGLPGCDGPDFSQRCPLWADDEYDHGGGFDIGCGRSMAQCGCALTSAASLLVRYGVTRSPDGEQTTPKVLNEWFKADTRMTSAGPVGRGFAYGGVNWLAVAAYSRLAADRWGTPSVTYAGNLGPDLGKLRLELDNGRPVILEEQRHYILAKGGGTAIQISDPFYAERTSLDVPSYGNRFLSGRLYRPSPDVSALMVATPAGIRFNIRDSAGRRAGLDSNLQPLTEISQSSFQRESTWRDPTCTAAPPKDPYGLQTVVLTQPGAGKYQVEVEGDPGSTFNVSVYAYDQDGGTTIRPFDGRSPQSGRVLISIDYTPEPGGEQVIELEPDGTPTPVPTPDTASGGTPAPSPTTVPTATPLPTRTPTPTEPPTRSAPTRTPTPSPTPRPGPAAKVSVSLAPTSFFCNSPDSYSLVTVTVTDADGRPAQTTPIVFDLSYTSQTTTSTIPGYITPKDTSTRDGKATARFYPPSGGSIRITARVPGIVTGPQGSAVFTCRAVFVPPVIAPPGGTPIP